jgi:hypothetical protein
MRWPTAWKDASAVTLLRQTPVDALLLEPGAGFGPVAAGAKQAGLAVLEAAPSGVSLIKGEWPGVEAPGGATGDAAGAGPTGNPWVDSNGWRIRLESALRPGRTVWVDAAPNAGARPESYALAFADAAAHGGRWVISLDPQFAAALAAGEPRALENWKKLAAGAGFFARRPEWAACAPAAVLGIVSDFSGENEFLGQELCNLVARTNQQYRIIPKSTAAAAAFEGLRAVIYADAAPPEAALRSQVMAFVEQGGLLVTGPKWGPPPGTPARHEDHFRYDTRLLGKGKVAVAKAGPDDPYLLANDAVVLMSHRYELLRFWNGGAVGSYFTVTPDRKRAIVHLLFYADRGPDATAVRVAGAYRTARLWTPDRADARAIETVRLKDAIELHLPAVDRYAAAELEV